MKYLHMTSQNACVVVKKIGKRTTCASADFRVAVVVRGCSAVVLAPFVHPDDFGVIVYGDASLLGWSSI